MLNATQKRFRKEMEKIEKQKRRLGQQDVYSYRLDRFESEYKKRSFKKPLITMGGIVGLLLVLYRLYALSTWIHPLTTLANSSQVTFNSNMDRNHNQQAIHNYFQVSNQVENTIHSDLNQLADPNAFRVLSNQSVLDMESKIVNLKSLLQTNLSPVEPLKNFEFNQIEIAKDVVEHMRLYKETQNISDYNAALQLVDQYNTNIKNKQTEVLIPILQSQHMPYSVDQNGVLRYNYIPNS